MKKYNIPFAQKLIITVIIASLCMWLASCQEPENETIITEEGTQTTSQEAPTSESRQTSEEITSETTSEVTTETTTETTEVEETGVTETDQMGYITSVTINGETTIDIDYVTMYSGADAIEKAIEDGSEVVEYDDDGPYIPNDYYIQNINPQIRTFPLSDSCEIYMIPEMGGPEATHLATANELKDAVDLYPQLVVIDVVDGEVVRIEQFYTP